MTPELVGLIGVLGAAFISGVFAVLAKKFREENTIQHEANQVRLTHIGREIGEVKADIKGVRGSQQRHLEWHAEQ
jgi:predicted methyltransferase